MKHSSFRLYVSLVCALSAAHFASGCGKSSGSLGSSHYQIPWPSADGGYSIQTVAIDGYESPQVLQGRFAKVYVDPFVEGGRLQGAPPVGRYIETRDGVAIPADYATLQATTIQAHASRLYEMDKALGIENEIGWPLTIGIQANVVDKRGSVRNNAVFDNKLDALLIVPYSEKRLPIALNAGILAHEHFHKIFQEFVLGKVPNFGSLGKAHEHTGIAVCNWAAPVESGDAPSVGRGSTKPRASLQVLEETVGEEADAIPVAADVYNSFLLRALNEGLADFWGWVYTGDPSFISHSLPSESLKRRLDQGVGEYKLHDLKSLKKEVRNPFDRKELLSEEDRASASYFVGTNYAKFLRELTVVLAGKESLSGEPKLESRLKVARALVQALPSLKGAALVAQAGTTDEKQKFLSPNLLLESMYDQLQVEMSPALCQVFERLQVPEVDGDTKPIQCAEPAPVPASQPQLAAEPSKEGGV